MAYHIDSMGRFATVVRRYDDRNGRIPELEDHPGGFDYGWEIEGWDEWVADADAAMRKMERMFAQRRELQRRL